MSSPESNFSAWLRKAEHDLLNIENNLAAKDIPWDTVCFHAQQATEKVLKAFLVHHGRDHSKTHDLVALLAQCVERDSSLRALEADCRKLTSYGVTSRYPDVSSNQTRRTAVTWWPPHIGSAQRSLRFYPRSDERLRSPPAHPEFSLRRAQRTLAHRRRRDARAPARSQTRDVFLSRSQGEAIELKLVNRIREQVKKWRADEYPGVTRTTLELLQWWRRDGRHQRLFFAQLDATETIIFLTEARADYRQGIQIPQEEISEDKREQGFAGFMRYASKMATGPARPPS